MQPAYEDDFGERLAVAWHRTTFEELAKVANGPFYNPAAEAPADEIAVPITWNGFPRRARIKWGFDEAVTKLDDLVAVFPKKPAVFRPHHEYLEWRVDKNPHTENVTRITFTCELQSYYEQMGASAPGKLLELYRTYVSPDVQHADLFRTADTGGVPQYDKLNRWNTTDGMMHLALPSNSLAAAVMLAQYADLHPNVSNTARYLTESARLICCGFVGTPNDAADLQIGSTINKLVQSGARASLKIPVAVYIAHYDTTCVTDRDGVPVPNFWRVLRGHPGIPGVPSSPARILRLEYAVPGEYGYEAGDLYVDGRPIRYGGQLARHIHMQLIAAASFGSSAPPAAAQPCTAAAYRDVQNHDLLTAVPTGATPSNSLEPAFPRDMHPTDAPPEPFLELGEIQGNVVVGFNKPHQALIGIRFGDAADARAWLRDLLRRVTFSDEAFGARASVREAREAGLQKPERNDTFVNVAFSAAGLERLSVRLDGMSQAFVDGQWRRAPAKLGDPLETGPGALRDWLVGGSAESTPDAIVVCAADRPRDRDGLRSEIVRGAYRRAQHVVYAEDGDDLPAADGISGREHFGFKDNIAKLRLRGMYPQGRFYNQRAPLELQDPTLPEFSKPGEPLVWPGQIVLGYPRQSSVDTREPMPADPMALPWLTRNGSYLVFRRLRQDVPLFRRFVARTAESAQPFGGTQPLAEARVAALLVGRWPDGTPLEVEPAHPPTNAKPTNDFVFARENWPPGSGSAADALGTRCPVTAHIRKVNPRDQGTDLGPPAENLCRAMLRRGIPYGPSLPPGEADDADRGLLFLSYQASIEDTFETITQSWMNSPAGPMPPPGFDMLVGRAPDGAERFCTIAGRVASIAQPFVYATGGGYFFAPSRSALGRLASGDPAGPS